MDEWTEWQTKYYNPRCACVPRVNNAVITQCLYLAGTDIKISTEVVEGE